MSLDFLYTRPDFGVLDDSTPAWMGFIEIFEQTELLKPVIKLLTPSELLLFLCKAYCFGIPNPHTLTDVLGEVAQISQGIIEINAFNESVNKASIKCTPEPFTSSGIHIYLKAPVSIPLLTASNAFLSQAICLIEIATHITFCPNQDNCLLKEITLMLDLQGNALLGKYCNEFILST